MNQSSVRSNSNKESGLEPTAYLSDKAYFLLYSIEAMAFPLVGENQKVVSHVADFKIP
jgi:hypothetical protein